MSDEQQIANEHFNRARFSEAVSRIFNILKPEDHELLSLDDVRKVLRPRGENYRGYRSVPIDKIIGSEGRYRDFSRQYLPKREDSRTRWTSIDRAHQRNVILPAVNLYEIAGYYFVRDGNHRVSVARAMGMREIDAIIVHVDTEIPLEDTTTKSTLKSKVLLYEKKEFNERTHFDALFPNEALEFTETGRYSELIKHFEGHYRCLLSKYPVIPFGSETSVLSFEDAIRSWRQNIYLPIANVLKEEKILARFPKRTVADMYIWIIKHRDQLRGHSKQEMSIKEVVHDLSEKYGKNRMERILYSLRRLFYFFKK